MFPLLSRSEFRFFPQSPRTVSLMSSSCLCRAFGRQLFEALLPLAVERLESEETSGSTGNIWFDLWKQNASPLLSRITSPKSRASSTSDESLSSLNNNSRPPLDHRQSTVLTTPELTRRSLNLTTTPVASRTFIESDEDDSDVDVVIVSEKRMDDKY